jgi:hypothetical protein
MYIYFKRSGGFTGISLKADLDTSSLPLEEAEAIEQILADVNFFELPSDLTDADTIDSFTYELKVIKQEEEHTVCFSEQTAPAEMDRLVRHLTVLARRPSGSAPEESEQS